MALIVKAFNDIAAGVRADLTTTDDLFVSAGATVSRTNALIVSDLCVTGQGSQHSVEVHGTIVNLGTAVALGDAAGDTDNSVIVGASGYIGAVGPSAAAVRFFGSGSSVLNNGTISAHAVAINFGGNNVGASSIENHGTINAVTYGIRIEGSTADFDIVNTGTITGQEAYTGSDGIDTILNTGMIDGEVLLGIGNDVYDGRGGLQTGRIDGQDGADTIRTGNGNDFIDGGLDVDFMAGGRGNDTYIVRESGDKTIELAKQGIDTIITAKSLSINGRAHIENLTIDTLAAANGTGNTLSNTIRGGDGAGKLFGLGGNDKLFGNAGADWLRGGIGADRLTGGADADRFEFKSVNDSQMATGRDKIMDFTRAQGDKVHLAAIDANTTVAGNQAFKFIGKAAFTGSGGELRYQKVGSDTHIMGDTNGDGVADLTILSDKVMNFVKGDFVL
jgi:Ca2+-binding RTX toxin-like protein